MRRRRKSAGLPASATSALPLPRCFSSLRRWLLAGGALGLAGCESLFGGFSIANPESCVASPTICGTDYCNPSTRLCEPAMSLTAVMPPVALGAGGDLLTVTGSAFAPGAIVRLGEAVVENPTLVSSEKLTGLVPASPARGPVPVEVELPSGQRVRREGLFRYVPPIVLSDPIESLITLDPRFLVTADVNRDGRGDLLVLGTSAPSSVFLGKSDGGFTAGPDFSYSGRARSITVGDLNGDGYVDLGLANLNAADVQIVLGGAGGSFQPVVAKITSTFPIYAQFGELTGDGKLDLMVIESAEARVYPGVGDGSFGNAIITNIFGSNPVSSLVVLSDLDGDGKLDLAAAPPFETRLYLARGLGDGRFEPPVFVGLPSTPYAMIVTDWNGDSKPELTIDVQPTGTPNIIVYERQQGFTFSAGTTVSLGFTAEQMVSGDLNGDGIPDLVALTLSKRSPNLAVVASLGDGRFAPPATLTYGVTLRSPVVLEASGDKRSDLVLLDSFSYGTPGNSKSKLVVKTDVSP